MTPVTQLVVTRVYFSAETRVHKRQNETSIGKAVATGKFVQDGNR